MKVFELMMILNKLPAGQEIKINGSESMNDPFDLTHISTGDDIDSTTIIHFDDSTIKYESELKEDAA